ESVHDRRNRGEQFRQEHERLAQNVGTEFRNENGDAERDRRRDEERQNGRIERAPDERERAELTGNRIPRRRAPELEAELRDRQHRLPRELEPDADDDEHEERAESASADAKPRFAVAHERLLP